MRLPFVSRFAYDEMKASLEDRVVCAEEEKQRLLDKLLRLATGHDGEPVTEQPVIEEPAEIVDENESQMARARRMTGSTRPSVIRKFMERENAAKFRLMRETAPLQVQAAVSDMESAFEGKTH